MKLQIKTLSPVHIGSGEKYNGLAYIQDKSQKPFKLCYLEFDKIKQVLNNQQLQNFSDWIITEKFPTILKFLQFKLNDRNNNITNQLIEKSLYKIDLLFVENFQERKFLGDIDSFLKQNNKVYIPGSEIKGAIRTAVLYKLLKDNDNWKFLEIELQNFQNKFKTTLEIISSSDKKASYQLNNNELKKIPGNEKQLLFGRQMPVRVRISDIKKTLVKEMGKIEEKLQKKVFRTQNNDDAKYDLLKHLSISDSESKKPDDCLFVSNLQTLNISKQFLIFQELLKSGQIFTCERFEINNNNLLFDKLGFLDEQKNILSAPENIFKCCYEFTNKLIEEEINYFNKVHKLEIVQKLKKIKQQNQTDSPVIRIGKNEGYLSLTIGLLIKEKDIDLYKNVVIHATKNTSYSNNFPKTRKIVNNIGNNDWDTLGWVKLILNN